MDVCTKVYLAAAIDLAKHKVNPFVIMAQKLAPVLCFNPAGAYLNANNGDFIADNFIAGTNASALKNSDVVVAYVAADRFSMGVPVEIILAKLADIPIILVMDEPKLGVYARLLVDAVVTMDELSPSLVDSVRERREKSNNALTQVFINTITEKMKNER